LVVGDGDEVPPPWSDAEVVELGPAEASQPAGVLGQLRSASAQRRRLVIRLGADLDRAPALATDADPHRVGARFAFDGEELHHLLWANSVDGRGGAARWLALDRAVAAGLRPVAAGAGDGDVLHADGTAMWLDAGPVRHTDPVEGVPVLHVVAIEHGVADLPGPNESTADLAADQLAAVTHPGGAARIIAPAGSGKTRVLTERARHLLRTWRLPASALTLVAFNKRAQEEMSARTPDLPGLHVRTLNAIALAIVNGTPPFAPRPRRWRTIDEPDVRRIIGDLVSFPRRRNSDPVAPWIEALSLVRLGLVGPAEVESRYGGDVDGFAEFWPRWCERLERQGVVDFDGQIHRALGVLLADPSARRAAQRACRVMLVDEFQDLTPAHLLLVRLLSAPGGAVFGVGDDDQTIYGYNGADPGCLIDFAELFPTAGAHPLEVNYRCPPAIVDAADRLLRHNHRRVTKQIRARPGRPLDDGGWRVDPSVDVVGATAGAVRSALAGGAAPSEVAVLARVNAVLAPVQVALVSEGIPISGGVGLEFMDRTAVRAVLAWLRLASPTTRFAADDLREALRRPSRSFHPRIGDWIAEQGDVIELFRLAGRLNNERDADRLTDFAADVQRLQQAVSSGAPTSDVLLTLIDEIGLAGSVATLDATRRGMNRGAQGDDLTAITHLAALHDDAATFTDWLRSRLAAKRSSDGVTLSTVHRVKGQEWPHVVVHHVDAEQYPHRLADDVEEERRLFHVALTRASQTSTITVGPNPSPFVDELTTEPSADRTVSTHAPAPAARAATTSSAKADPTADLDPAAAARFDRLKALRTELADGKPAYVVFDNKTLAAIARVAPTSTRDLARISGVGPAKLDKYGDAVLGVLDELR
ncbi:MAG: ATP-dependent DNA helicase UvrD2, partial [Actinomycetota bacterium]